MKRMKMKKHSFWPLLALSVLTIAPTGCKKNKPVVAQFSASKDEVLVDETVTFMNTSLNATQYRWDFGDGGASTDLSPEYAFSDDGDYEVSLIALGEDNSDTAFQNVDVYHDYVTTMYEGSGINGAFLADSWSDVKAEFGTDTTLFSSYYSDVQLYYHTVYYDALNFGLLFISEDSLVADSDPLAFLYVFFPFEGGTTKRVGFSSTMKRAKDTYGTPENTDQGNGYTGYWYDSQGIDIYTYGSDYVDEIDLYDPNSLKAVSKTFPDKEFIGLYRQSEDFRNILTRRGNIER